MNVSVLIPSHLGQRFDWLKHRLNFLYKLGYTDEVVVGVWGGQDRIEDLRNFCRILSPNIRVVSQDGATRFTTRMVELAQLASGEYAVAQGDDDFIIPGAVNNAASLLARDPSVCCAQGRFILLDPTSSYPSYRINYFPLWQALEEEALPRFSSYMKHFGTTFHGVYRRPQFIERMTWMDETKANTRDEVLFEYMGEMYTVIKGKFAILDEIFFVKGMHEDNTSKTLRANLSHKMPPYMILSPDFSSSYKFFEGQVFRLLESVGVDVGNPDNRKQIMDGLVDFVGFMIYKRRDRYDPQEAMMRQMVSEVPVHPAVDQVLRFVTATAV